MTSTDTARAQDSLVGLAFPVIRVRFAGPTDYRVSRYIATVRGVRHTESYDHALSGPQNAYNAAAAVWEKYRAEHPAAYQWDEEPRVFIPGDLDADSYAYTVVPNGFLTTDDTATTAETTTDAEQRTGNEAPTDEISARLEYLRSQLDAECISYGELAELQGLAEHIDPSDVQLLEAAGVPEFPETNDTETQS